MLRTRKQYPHVSPIFFYGLLAVFSASPIVQGADALTRSFYVPVQIELCDHLSQAVLYRGQEAIRPLPGKQVFQFTYYPSLHRIVPETERIHIKALRDNGEPFQMELVVTSSAVYIGNKCIHLDLKKQMSRLRAHVDVHYEPVVLKIACGESCTRPHKEARKVAAR